MDPPIESVPPQSVLPVTPSSFSSFARIKSPTIEVFSISGLKDETIKL